MDQAVWSGVDGLAPEDEKKAGVETLRPFFFYDGD